MFVSMLDFNFLLGFARDISSSIEMDIKKPYVVAISIQVIYAGMFVVIKAAFNKGFNTFVFVFYSLLLLPIGVLQER